MFQNYDDILTITDVSEILKVSNSQTYKLVRTGQLKAYKEGKDWRIPRIALENYIRSKLNITPIM